VRTLSACGWRSSAFVSAKYRHTCLQVSYQHFFWQFCAESEEKVEATMSSFEILLIDNEFVCGKQNYLAEFVVAVCFCSTAKTYS
jgi:hypothetical protein